MIDIVLFLEHFPIKSHVKMCFRCIKIAWV